MILCHATIKGIIIQGLDEDVVDTEVDMGALCIIEEDWVAMDMAGLVQNLMGYTHLEMVMMVHQEEVATVVEEEDIIQIVAKEVVMYRENRIERSVVDTHALIHINQDLNIEKDRGRVLQEPDLGLLCKFDICKNILRSF